MPNIDVLNALAELGGYLTDDHFVYTSGRHGETYLNKDAIYTHPHLLINLCMQMADRLDEKQPDIVVGPEKGGIILSFATASMLDSSEKHILNAYAEKTPEGGFELKRGYDKLIPGRKVAVVEDVITTGGSVIKMVEALRALDASQVFVIGLINRGGDEAKQAVEATGAVWVKPLVTVDIPTWTEEDFPHKNRPVNTEVGKGAEYMAKKAKENPDQEKLFK